MATRIIPKTHLRDRIRSELDELGDDTLVVTERGRPVAVLVAVDRWNDLQETLELLADQLAVLSHRIDGATGTAVEEALAAIESDALPGHRRSPG